MGRDGGGRAGAVADWMSRPPIAVAEETPIREAMAHMQRSEVRHLLVMDGPVLTGIFSSRDLRRLALGDPGSSLLGAPVRSIMSEGPMSVTPDTPMVAAARLLLEHRIGALPVRDGERILGIFTVADALEALLAGIESPGG